MIKIGLFLETLGLGFGVSVVVKEQVKFLLSENYKITLFFIEGEGWNLSHPNLKVIRVRRHFVGIKPLIKSLGCNILIAHTSPFFELFTQLDSRYKKIIWEHGNPPAHLFPKGERDRRQKEIDNKKQNVYEYADEIVCISEFIRNEIGTEAEVIYNGIDHLSSNRRDANKVDKIKIISISRLSVEESNYKGTLEFVELANQIKLERPNWEFVLIGKGSEADAKFWRSKGVHVANSISDDDLILLIKESSALISLSKWEGFNLPLVEAQYYGLPALALDYGAHKEVTPWLYSSIDELYKDLLRDDFFSESEKKRKSQQFLEEFTWVEHGKRMLLLLEKLSSSIKPSNLQSYSVPGLANFILLIWKIESSIKQAIRGLLK